MKRCAMFFCLMIVAAIVGANATTDLQSAVSGNNELGLRLYREVSGTTEGNLALSPFSIYTALMMAYAGAGGTTRDQMRELLGAGADRESCHAGLAALTRKLLEESREAPGQNLMRLANSLWLAKDLTLLGDFLGVIERHYGGNLFERNFRVAPDVVRREINDWVKGITDGMIPELLAEGKITSATNLVLVNALFFMRQWNKSFSEHLTKPAIFQRSPTESAELPFMHNLDRYAYLETPDFQALDLPYLGNGYSMVFFLPTQVDGIPALEERLFSRTGELSQLLTKMSLEWVDVALPKFKVKKNQSLNQALIKLGIPEVFLARADFSGMTGGRDFRIDDVTHEAVVEVDEKGTRAAAATAVSMTSTSVLIPTQVHAFTADHPFLFLILDNTSHTVLFVGRVADPNG